MRSTVTGLVVLLLGVIVERWRSRKKIPPALVTKATYDERIHKSAATWIIVLLGLGIPLLFTPERVRVIGEGIVVVTPVGYFLLPMVAIDRVERSGRLQALLGAGVNLAGDPSTAVRIFRKRRLFPVVISVEDPKRFIDVVHKARQ